MDMVLCLFLFLPKCCPLITFKFFRKSRFY